MLVCSIPVYYLILSRLWHYELNEHNVVVTKEKPGREDILIISFVTWLTVLVLRVAHHRVSYSINRRTLQADLWKPLPDAFHRSGARSEQRNSKRTFEDTDIDEFDELNPQPP